MFSIMKGVTINKNNSNRITVAFSYIPEFVAKVKTIPGHRWNPEEKYWRFPATDGTKGMRNDNIYLVKGYAGTSARVKISAPGADTIPNWKYISTQC